MKLFPKFLLAALVLAALLPFTILKDDQGRTLMNFSNLMDFSNLKKFSDLSLPDMPSFGGVSKLAPPSTGGGSPVNFYKWYDADGNVQFTTEPPADGIQYTVKEYDPNVNVIQSVEAPEAETVAVETTNGDETISPQPGQTSTFDVDAIKKMFEDTENIEKLLNERYQNQNSNLNQ